MAAKTFFNDTSPEANLGLQLACDKTIKICRDSLVGFYNVGQVLWLDQFIF